MSDERGDRRASLVRQKREAVARPVVHVAGASSLPMARHAVAFARGIPPLASTSSFAPSASWRPARASSRPRARPAAPRASSAGDASPSVDYFATDKRPVILFDGVCNLCNGGVNFALDMDPPGKLRFAALQSTAGRALLRRAGRDPDDISSIVLVEEDAAFVKSDAVLRIATYFSANPLFPFAGTLGPVVPTFIRDAFYDAIADNRYDLLGMKDECRLGDDRFDDRFVQ